MTYSSIFKNHVGLVSDKWEAYLLHYDQSLTLFSPKKILEIGVQNGGSLEIWSRLFPDCDLILGIDIDEKCSHLTFESSNIKVLVADAASYDTVRKVENFSKTFDLVIDDGSHRSEDIIANLLGYLPKVSAGGKYIIEDLHASYWADWGGGLQTGLSAISFLKRLIDCINSEHWNDDLSVEQYLTGFVPLTETFLDAVSRIGKIQFTNSICEIQIRGDGEVPSLGKRLISGNLAKVNPVTFALSGSASKALMNKQPANLESLHPLADLRLRGDKDSVEATLRLVSNERDALLSERDALLSERDALMASWTWKLTRPIRKIVDVVKS